MIKYLNNLQDMTQSYYKLFCDFHEKDTGHFIRIKNDIFDICSCAVFYREDRTEDPAEVELAVKNANLYILIVSSKLLSDPSFDERPFRTARENNVPILPILTENGLEELFNERFGNLQCISTCLELTDPTAVPYIEKLQNFLSGTLSLSYDINELRKAFDGSLFLSYRKKDRAYAQSLLDVIHSSDELKNISVWYDEFLVPGEDFNDSIKSELENSAIFILMVTPSILEEQNYIKTIEYPVACSLNKPVFPVETVPTDRGELASAYPEIPAALKIDDTKELKKKLLKLLADNGIVIAERSAERDFFIGFAFLKGMYVEKNTAAAIELITRAAQADVVFAVQTLAHIYKYADGCEADLEKAALWQNKYIELVREGFEAQTTWENALTVIFAYRELADICTRSRDTDSAAHALEAIVDFLEVSPFKGGNEAMVQCAMAYEEAASLFIGEGDYSRARYDYAEKAVKLRKELYSEIGDTSTKTELCAAYLLLARCQKESDDIIGLKSTVKVEMKQIRESLIGISASDGIFKTLYKVKKVLVSLISIGEYFTLLGMEDQAFVYNGTALHLAEELHGFYDTVGTAMLFYTALRNDAMQHISINVENHLRTACSSLTKAHSIALFLYGQDESLENILTLAQSHLDLGRVVNSLKSTQEALGHVDDAVKLLEKALGMLQSVPVKQRVYQAYYTAAEIFARQNKTAEAEVLLNKGLELNEDIVNGSSLAVYKLEMADALRIKGDLLKKQWDFDLALECYIKRHELILAGAHKNVHIYLIAESYQSVIAAHKAVGNFAEAGQLARQLNEFKNKYSYVFNGSVKLYK